MKKILIMSLLASSTFSFANKVSWNDELPTVKLANFNQKSTQTPAFINNEKRPITYNYALKSEDELTFENKGFTDESRQFWLDSNIGELSKGIQIPVSHTQAVIRISPLVTNGKNKSNQITASMLELSMNGQVIQSKVFADGNSLKATGAPFSDTTIAFRLDTTPGILSLKINGLGQNDTPYVVHVLEPGSSNVLTMVSDKQSYQASESMTVYSSMGSEQGLSDATITGYINKPNGTVVSQLAFNKTSDGRYAANVTLPEGMSMGNGLWEIHTFAQSNINGQKVLRDAHSSFSVNLNSANFNGNLALEDSRLNIGINNALEGRYEVKGVLYGQNAKGESLPIAMLMSAAWLKSGQQSIALQVDQKLINDSGLKAPFEVRNVQLMNQSLLAPVQTVLSGITIDNME